MPCNQIVSEQLIDNCSQDLQYGDSVIDISADQEIMNDQLMTVVHLMN